MHWNAGIHRLQPYGNGEMRFPTPGGPRNTAFSQLCMNLRVKRSSTSFLSIEGWKEKLVGESGAEAPHAAFDKDLKERATTSSFYSTDL